MVQSGPEVLHGKLVGGIVERARRGPNNGFAPERQRTEVVLGSLTFPDHLVGRRFKQHGPHDRIIQAHQDRLKRKMAPRYGTPFFNSYDGRLANGRRNFGHGVADQIGFVDAVAAFFGGLVGGCRVCN